MFKNGGRPRGLVLRAKLKPSALDSGRTASELVFSHVFRKCSTARKIVKRCHHLWLMLHNNFCWGLKQRKGFCKYAFQWPVASSCSQSPLSLSVSLSLCLSLLSPLLPVHVEEMRWGTWWWNEERVQSLWLILRVTERCCQRVSSCLNLLYWAGVQPELTLPWIPVPCCRSEPQNPAGRWASECLPLFRGTRAVLCHEELQPLLAAPSPLCRNVLQARCSPSLSHIMGCYHIQGTLAPS